METVGRLNGISFKEKPSIGARNRSLIYQKREKCFVSYLEQHDDLVYCCNVERLTLYTIQRFFGEHKSRQRRILGFNTCSRAVNSRSISESIFSLEFFLCSVIDESFSVTI